MTELQIWADGIAGEVIGCDVWNVRTVVACDWSGGRLLAFAAENGHLDVWGDGYSHPEDISIVGDDALITEQTGTLLRQNLSTPGRAHATVVASGLGAPHQVVRAGAAALVADYSGGRIIRVDLGAGSVNVVATGLGRPVGLAVGAGNELYVSEQQTGALIRIDEDGTRSTVVSGLVAPFFLTWANPERTALLVTERAPANRLGLVDLNAGEPAVQRLLGRLITQPSASVLVEGRLVVTGHDRLLSLDVQGGLRPGVAVSLPSARLWPGEWIDAEIDTGVSGYRRADVAVTVEPPAVAAVSEHPGADADPARPTVRILAGGAPGTAAAIVRDAATAEELGRAEFSVGVDGDVLPDGPPLWVDQPVAPPPAVQTLTLENGVDDAGALTPRDRSGAALPRWRVVAVLVDTGSAMWPAAVSPTAPAPDIATAQTYWRDTLVGSSNSAHLFFSESSADKFGISLVNNQVLGPVNLGKSWTDWFTQDTPGGPWWASPAILDIVVGSLQNQGISWLEVDCVFMIIRSPNTTQFVWPGADTGKTRTVLVQVPGVPFSLPTALAGVVMPHNQGADIETSCHEFGHTYGLNDLYMDASNPFVARDIGAMEPMSDQSGLPHLCARHKLLLGFLDPVHVRTFSWDIDADEFVDLHPISDGTPTGGRSAAIELKVAPKLSWFFEFRQRRPGRVGDQSAAFTGGKIVGYDAVTYRDPPVVTTVRPPIILLSNDDDGEGPVLDAVGEDYETLDPRSPARLATFRLEVQTIGPDVARVRVTVRKTHQPDPSIRNNPGNGNFKSPDIEVHNDFTDKNPTFPKVPMLDVRNRVVAKVTNAGEVDAPNVSVRLSVLPFSTDDPRSARWQQLGEPVKHDIPAGATVDFETAWQPKEMGHYCVQARIDRYVRVPGAVADEPDVDNNLAQSNYVFLWSIAFSPASREVSHVDVHNPYPHPVNAVIELRQDHPGYRSYVDHRWLRLEAGQTRSVRVEVESTATSIWDVIERPYPDGRTWIRSWLDRSEFGDTPRTGTGATLAVRTAVASAIWVVERGTGLIILQVTSPAGAPPPHDGAIVMQVDYDDGQSDLVTGPVQNNGFAHLAVRPVPGHGTAHFSGTQGYAPTFAKISLLNDD